MANGILFSDAMLALQGGSKLKNAPVENKSAHCEMLQKDFNLTVFQAYKA